MGGLLPDRDLSTLLRELGIGAVPHGFRSSFRDWAAEEDRCAPHAVMEAALSHVIRNQVEAAYARSDLFERRRVPDGAVGRIPGRGPENGRCLSRPPLLSTPSVVSLPHRASSPL